MTLGCTVAELKRRMSSREYTEWLAYFSIEPWPLLRQEIAGAYVGTALAKCLGAKRVSVDDLMPDYGPPKRQTPQEMQTVLRCVFAAAGHKVPD